MNQPAKPLLPIDPGTLPRRIILSRKGSDSTWGGRPSLRLGKQLISLPIPESLSRARAATETGHGLRFGDLPPHPEAGALHTHLRDIGPERFVHLDPDLRSELRPLPHRLNPERIFGQEGAAARHLENQHVGPGDLFLFFGWFRPAARLASGWKRTGPDEHCLWGWLQVAETHPVTSALQAEALPWAAHHPHIAHWERFDAANRIYRARPTLSFAPDLPGAGVFAWRPALTLTRQCTRGATRREWCLPALLRRAGLTYNQVEMAPCPAHRERVHLRSAAIGQEFVAPAHRAFRAGERNGLTAWLADLFSPVPAND